MNKVQFHSDLDRLIEILPPKITKCLSHETLDDVIELVLDLGRQPEIRHAGGSIDYLGDDLIVDEDIKYITDRIQEFTKDNRSGIPGTLHRISAIRNRQGKIVGLTCRIGRVVTGTIACIKDFVVQNKSILFLGRPGVGKTTKLREISRLVADELHKRVVVVDTSNEIAGDGDTPHPAIGHARRMQVTQPEFQKDIMIEAVENHTPEVIVVDEIGTEAEAQAARTIAERGVMLIATAHGNSLENLIKNPVLSDLVGGIQSVTLGDDEAKRRACQKTVLEREKQAFDRTADDRKQPELKEYSQFIGAYLKPELNPAVVSQMEESEIIPSFGYFVTRGLSDAVKRLVRDSGLGAKIYVDRIPFAGKTFDLGRKFNIDPISAALNGGDDFRLIYTVPIGKHDRFRHDFQTFDIIGHLARPDVGAVLVTPDGVELPLHAQGWKD